MCDVCDQSFGGESNYNMLNHYRRCAENVLPADGRPLLDCSVGEDK